MAHWHRMTRVLLIGVLTVMVGCSSQNASEGETSSGTLSGLTLRVGLVSDNPMIFLRESSSEFDGTEYTVEWVEFDSATTMLEAAAAGAVDFIGFLQPPTTLLAQGNAQTPWDTESAPFAIIAAWANPDHPGFSLVVKDPTTSNASDLAGGKVAFAQGSIGHYFWALLVESEGIDDVEAVFLPAAEARSAFQSGAVEGLITGYRAALSLEQRGLGTIIDSASRVIDNQFVSVASAPALGSAEKIEAIRDFLTRIERAVQILTDNPEPLVEYLTSVADLPINVAQIMARLDVPPRTPLDAETIGILRQVADVFVANGVMASDVEIDVIIDRRFDEGVERRQ